MKYRCEDPSCPSYKNYGGRGITICDEWSNGYEGYFAFKEWSLSHGYSKDLTIDRIDNDCGYSPENCRWVSSDVQGNNKRCNRRMEYNGKVYTMAELSRLAGIPYHTFAHRLYLGWDLERAVNQPLGKASR